MRLCILREDSTIIKDTYPTTVGKPCRPKSDQTGATTTSRACCTLLHLSLFEMRRTRRQANERARGQRLWRNGRNEPARQAARPPRPAAPPSTSRKAAAGGRRKLASSCDSELRLQPQLDTPSPLGRGSRHAPNKLVCQLRRGTVVAFLLVLPVGTDQARFELRLQPQLDTPSPLGRGSSHAPNKPVRLLRRGTVLSFRWALTSAASSL